MAQILIPDDPHQRNVLAAVRALGRDGHTIHIACPINQSRSRHFPIGSLWLSRYVQRVHYVRFPLASPTGFIDDILNIVSSRQYDAIIPFTSTSCPLISKHKPRLKPYTRVLCANYPTYRQLNDKHTACNYARSLGLKVPWFFCPKSVADIQDQMSGIRYPVVVKARVNCGMDRGLRYAHRLEDVLDYYREISNNQSIDGVREFDMPIIQEWIPGKIYDAAYYYHEGSLIAAFTQRRDVTIPLDGGSGVLNVSVTNEKLLEYGKTILDGIKWHGPAQVEVKLDTRDNEFKLIEINPKFWGTLDLAIKCGVNFPKIALELAMHGRTSVGLQMPSEQNYKYRWLDMYISACRKGGFSRLHTLKALMKATDYSDIDYRDLRPTLYSLVKSAARLMGSA